MTQRTIDAEMNSVAEQYLAGAEDVAALGAGAHGLRRFSEPAARLVDAVGESVRYEMRVQGSIKSVMAICLVAVLAAGAAAMSRGWTDVAGVILAFQLVRIVRDPVEHLTWRLQESQGVAGAARRIVDLLEERRRVVAGTGHLPAGPLDLRFERTGLVYDDALEGETALDDFDLTIAAGRVVGLVGRSGSGKTTLARLVLRLVAPTSGRVLVGGVDVVGARRRRVPRADRSDPPGRPAVPRIGTRQRDDVRRGRRLRRWWTRSATPGSAGGSASCRDGLDTRLDVGRTVRGRHRGGPVGG